jgi:hypothetical protein
MPSPTTADARVEVSPNDALVVGHRYFFRRSRRTDAFRHKRYSDPAVEKWEALVVMGRVIEQRGGEVKIAIEECGMSSPDPSDGDEVVVSVGSGLTVNGGAFRTLEEHGKPNVVLCAWIAQG